MLRLLNQLWLQVLVATVLGGLVGWAWPGVGEALKPLGDGFIALVRMIIAPIIFCTVVHGIAGMNDMRRVGRVAVKALVYFEAVTTLALILALVAVNLWRPGEGMDIDPARLDLSKVEGYAARAHDQTVQGFLLHIIPDTFVGAFAQPDVLQVLFVSVLFAFGLILTGERGRPILDGIEAASSVFFRVVGIVMRAAPIGAFGAMAFTVGSFGADALVSLGALIVEFWTVCAVFVLVVLGAIARLVGVSILKLMGHIRDEIVLVAGAGSTEIVLPRIMEKLRRLGCEESVVGLVVPTGYSFNLDGTCLYLATAAVFLAQATNTPLDLGHQIGLLLVLLLTSKGAAAVPGAAFVVLAGTLGAVGTIPLASIALILGIHKLMALALTFVNLVGNTLASIVVAKWEKAVDEEALNAVVGVARDAAAPSVGSDVSRSS